jgi:uncharacterized protein (UPF0332 family)
MKSGLLPEELYGYLLTGFRERQIGDHETINLPSFEDAEEIAQKAEIFLAAAKINLTDAGYDVA